jgi:hypothetical protein
VTPGSAPPALGDPIPAFSCRDLNDTSPTYGTDVTGVVLGEQVWIAYFGACT